MAGPKRDRQHTHGHFQIAWLDAGMEPRVKPNPAYPDGIDVDLTTGPGASCTVPLPYPAQRIGGYVISCQICGLRVGCTTAGRPDDPRSATMTCKELHAA